MRGYLPGEVLVVSESGIRGADDVARVAAAGADAVLVGEALVRSGAPGRLVEELGGGAAQQGEQAVTVQAKVCGVMSPRDARVVDGAGADYLGVILSPGFSRRRAARPREAGLRGVGARRVGVFVDAASEQGGGRWPANSAST